MSIGGVGYSSCVICSSCILVDFRGQMKGVFLCSNIRWWLSDRQLRPQGC
ncbi:unnamed protein product [Spirodela intermedia]|uniref:Uncharacterized protein n=1 Tax=Spirodela intermedia TaxID=51605 RepID=A0A7I8JD64_SPIIN|nr:unnamed protein product [Spirodela intermedia]CAA6668090.1 unnamed protein product [Spirodela intermedia]